MQPRDGRDGRPGPQGIEGPPGPPGRDGKDARDGVKGEPGNPGLEGPPGPEGPVGPMPDHEWDGTRLRFQKPGDLFGPFVDLQGPAGPPGPPGPTLKPGIGGGGTGAGTAGPPGPAGANGADGAVGPTGATGPQGPQGYSVTGPAGAAFDPFYGANDPTAVAGNADTYFNGFVAGGSGTQDPVANHDSSKDVRISQTFPAGPFNYEVWYTSTYVVIKTTAWAAGA